MTDSEKIAYAIRWANDRIAACGRTERTSMVQQRRDWAYAERLVLRAMIDILEGRVTP